MKLTVATGPTGKPTLFLDGQPMDPAHRITLTAADVTGVALAYGAYGVNVGRAARAQQQADLRADIAERLRRIEGSHSTLPTDVDPSSPQ